MVFHNGENTRLLNTPLISDNHAKQNNDYVPYIRIKTDNVRLIAVLSPGSESAGCEISGENNAVNFRHFLWK